MAVQDITKEQLSSAYRELNDAYEFWSRCKDSDTQDYADALWVAVELVKKEIDERIKQVCNWKQDRFKRSRR